MFVAVGNSVFCVIVLCHKELGDILITSRAAADARIRFIYLPGSRRWSGLPFVALGINAFPELMELSGPVPSGRKDCRFAINTLFRDLRQIFVCVTCAVLNSRDKKTWKVLLIIRDMLFYMKR